MNIVSVTIRGMITYYVIGAIVTVCDPVLVSEEAAQNSEILRITKNVTDWLIDGYKFGFMISVMGVTSILKKDKA